MQKEVVDAGLLIHEGQLLFPQLGLHRVLDLGIWWHEKTKLPLPLGGNAVRRALGPELGRHIAKTIRDSVQYGLEHREEALNYAMQFAREMDTELADKFVGMYVNKWTLGYGEKGKKAVRELIERGTTVGLLPGPAKVEFLEEKTRKTRYFRMADIHDKSVSRGQKLSRRASEKRGHKILGCFSSRSCLSAVVPLRLRTRHPFAVSAPKGLHRRLSL